MRFRRHSLSMLHTARPAMRQRSRLGRRIVAGLVAAALATGLPVPMASTAAAATCATTPMELTWDSVRAGGLVVDLQVRSVPTSIDWGDGTTTSVTTVPAAATSHTYTADGAYNISLCNMTMFGLGAWTNRGAAGFTAVTSFASGATDLAGAFSGWTNLTDVPASLPPLVSKLDSMFKGAKNFNDPDIGSWNTANITSMTNTFYDATAFNQPIGSWDTSKVTTMTNMFNGAWLFNQPIGTWNVSKVTDFRSMFSSAKEFDQDIGAWSTVSATRTDSMFANSPKFNNGGSDAIKNWNTSLVTNTSGMFNNALVFNQPIGSWNTSKVTDFSYMFAGALVFDQPLGDWNTSSATKMKMMFASASAFNQPIGSWNTSKVTTMQSMFYFTAFNQPIGLWDTGLVTDMRTMFERTPFDQDLGGWNPVALISTAGAENLMPHVTPVMSTANYDKLLIGWSGRVVRPSVKLGFGKHKYSCAAEAARAKLTGTPNTWVITDGGLAEMAPTISTIVPGDGKLSVYFTAPTCMSTMRANYEYSTDGGTTWVAVSPASLASPIVITGLTNDTSYSVKVRAIGGTIGGSTPASTAVRGTPAGSAGVTAKNETSVYGAAVPTIGYTTTLATGDWVGSVTCGAYTDSTYTTAVSSSTKPGAYVTRCTGSTTSGLGSTLTYTDGTYSVTKAPLTVTAATRTKTYGTALTLDDTVSNGSTDVTVTGLVNGDAISKVTLTTLGAVATAGAAGSPYSVVPSAALDASSAVLTDRYTITYPNGSITVNKAAALSVTPNTYTINLGDTGPVLIGFDVTGFVSGESFSTTGYTAPTCGVYDGSTLQPPPYDSLAAGTYTVKCSAGVAGNYASVTYSESKFVVKASNIEVAAKNASSTYGSVPAADTGHEVVGDLNGATVTCSAYTDNSYTSVVTATTAPGTYVTHCSGPSDNGASTPVAIDYVDGTYTVEKAALTITAASRTKTYGTALTFDEDLSDGSTDVTVTGLMNGDQLDSVVLTTSGAVATAGVSGSAYNVVPSAAVMLCDCSITDLYDITYEKGSLTVTKKTLTIEADDVSLEVGAAVPANYTFTTTGWVNGEDDGTNLPDGWVAPTCDSSFNSTTPLGTPVEITCTGGSADDYDFNFTKGTVSIGNPEVTVSNTTTPAHETSGSTANVSLKATITNWAPGCKVTFTLSPSAGTASPYTVYTTASNDVSASANLPVGVYDINTSVSEGCTGTADTTGVVAVVPIGPGGAAHVDTYGTRYRDSATGKTVVLNMEWLRKVVRTRNATTSAYESRWVNESYYNWSIYGANQWRIAAKPFSGTVTITDGDTQSATVSTWGRMDCPAGMYPAGNASVCSAVTNIVMLQEWVPRPSNPKYGTWRNVGEVLIVEKLAEGRWPYRCATLACKTPLPDHVAFQMRPVPGDSTPTVIPTGLPVNTDWTRVTYGDIVHK